MDQIAWKIGGDQGEGIDSTGDVIATVASRMGYFVYGYKSFSSRIKGGHTHYKVRIADHPVRSAVPETHVLVALTQETIDKSVHEVVPGGAVIADEGFAPSLPDGCGLPLIAIPMGKIARELGNPVVRNMVAVGATSALLGVPLVRYEAYVSLKFEGKGQSVVDINLAALRAGFEAARAALPDGLGFTLPEVEEKGRLLMTGNEAIALGALAGGCRIMAAYPITPASDVMENLVGLLPQHGGVVCQMEDEIAAITLVIGAGYAGARAMTATAGPGFSLMQEGMGLAAMAEVPAVIVDCQRSGPSTGMPTKSEQSDIMAAIFGGHGEGGRIVLSPSTVEEAFADTAEAFNLAERYQTPVIIASDLALSEWKQTVEHLPIEKVTIDRGEIAPEDFLRHLQRGSFDRYALTDSGISPRSLPGQPHGQYLATGVEHLPSGKVSEDPKNRKGEVDKRARKFQPLIDDPTGVDYEGPAAPDLVIASFGSVTGAIEEAIATIADPTLHIGRLKVRRLWPFPATAFRKYLEAAGEVMFIEQNSTSQLRRLAELVGIDTSHATSLLRYDGILFTPQEIQAAIRSRFARQEVS